MSTSAVAEEHACGCSDHGDAAGSGCICLTSDIVQTMGRRYSLHILSLLGDRGVVRFNEIKNELGEISSSTLSLRLSELEIAGLVTRQTFNEIPPKVEYSLTREGQALRKQLLSLSRRTVRRKQH